MVIRRESVASFGALAVIVLLAVAGPTSAAVLVDGNSTVTIDPASLSGVSSWTINGVNHLDYSWLWYGGAILDKEYSLDSVYIGEDTGTNWLKAYYGYEYTGGYVLITLDYVLTEGAGQSTLEGTMTLVNGGEEALDAELFALFDFDLNGTADGDTIERLGDLGMRQTHGNTTVDVLVNEVPSGWEIAESPTIYDKLTDGDKDNLDNSESFSSDGEFAWQWSASIMASQTMKVGLGKATITTTPEPASLLIWTVLGAALGLTGWRRSTASRGDLA